jgi:nicotinamide riboside transporter PnuC
MNALTTSDLLQIAGWVLTVVGQVQVGRMSRAGFLTWIAANAVMIGLCVDAGLYWSVGMYATNAVICGWSFCRWPADEKPARSLFVKRMAWWRAS